MQSTMNPVSRVGRAILPGMQGSTPDQAAARASEIAKTGLVPFDQAIGMKQMADSISNSGATMNQAPPETVVAALRRQIQEALNPPPPAPPQMDAGVASLPMSADTLPMAGGGIVAFQGGGDIYQAPRVTNPIGESFSRLIGADTRGAPQRIPYEESDAVRVTNPIGESFSRLIGADTRGAPQRIPYEESDAVRVTNPIGESFSRLIGADSRPFLMTSATSRTPPPPPQAPAPAPSAGLPTLVAPDKKDIRKEVDVDYKGLKDALRRQDDILKDRGAGLKERFDSQSKLLLAMTGFQMAAEASKPGATFLGSAGSAGAEYAKSRMAANEKFAENMDRLADSRAELDVAGAKLTVDSSVESQRRYDLALQNYNEQQKIVLQEQALRAEEAKNNLYRQINAGDITVGQVQQKLFAAAERLRVNPEDPAAQRDYDLLKSVFDTLSGGTAATADRRNRMTVAASVYKDTFEQLMLDRDTLTTRMNNQDLDAETRAQASTALGEVDRQIEEIQKIIGIYGSEGEGSSVISLNPRTGELE